MNQRSAAMLRSSREANADSWWAEQSFFCLAAQNLMASLGRPGLSARQEPKLIEHNLCPLSEVFKYALLQARDLGLVSLSDQGQLGHLESRRYSSGYTDPKEPHALLRRSSVAVFLIRKRCTSIGWLVAAEWHHKHYCTLCCSNASDSVRPLRRRGAGVRARTATKSIGAASAPTAGRAVAASAARHERRRVDVERSRPLEPDLRGPRL